MPEEVIFCPNCGTQQLKPDARFCHICGLPIPPLPTILSAPPKVTQPRRLTIWWLLPLLLLCAVALLLFAWEPARYRIDDFLAQLQSTATGAIGAVQGDDPARTALGGTTIVLPTEKPTVRLSVPPTSTMLPTETLQPAARPTPIATQTATATPLPTATLSLSATPARKIAPKAPLAASRQFLTISLQEVANASSADGYVDPPVGDVVLSDVLFSLSKGASITTQAVPLPDNPTSISLPVDAEGPQMVYLLLTGGDLYSRFTGRTVGSVRLVFGGGQAYMVDLVVGQNLREWKYSSDVVTSATDPALTEVWRGTNHFDSSAAVIDMLTIPVPLALQSGSLASIEVTDLSLEALGDFDPALNLLGVSVVLRPTPTSTVVPTAVACRLAPGEVFQALWQEQRGSFGCPLSELAQSAAATEQFQRGRMIWRETNDMIYVLYSDGDWAAYPDIYQEGAGEPGGFEPPAGLQTPVRGFGATWRAKLGGTSARIGWATQDEYAVSIQSQDFERRLMVEMEGRVYLLGDSGGRWRTP